MSFRSPFLSDLSAGLPAGLFWTAGFLAAFPLWRFANFVGVVLLGLLVGSLEVLFLTRRGWRRWFEGHLASLALSLPLTILLWNLPWYNSLVLFLYRGYHVTEAGFSGLFSILFYVGTSRLWFFLLSGVCLAWKGRGSGKKGA